MTAEQFESRYLFLSEEDIEPLKWSNERLTVTATVGRVEKNDDGDRRAYLNVMAAQEIGRLDSVAYFGNKGEVRVSCNDLCDSSLVTLFVMRETQVDSWPDVKAGDRVVVEIERAHTVNSEDPIDDNALVWFTVATVKGYEERFEEVLRPLIEERSFEVAAPVGHEFMHSRYLPPHSDRTSRYNFPNRTGIVISMPKMKVRDFKTNKFFYCDDDWRIEVTFLSVHTGDFRPVPVWKVPEKMTRANADHIYPDLDVHLERIPMDFLDLFTPKYQREVGERYNFSALPKEIKGTPNEVWSGPPGYIEEMLQKSIFLRNYMHMVYILDSGKMRDKQAAYCLFRALGRRNLRDFSTDCNGDEYWFQNYWSPSSSGSSTYRKGNEPSVRDLYLSDEQASTHYWNTN